MKTSTRVLSYWTPRVLCIFVILLVSLHPGFFFFRSHLLAKHYCFPDASYSIVYLLTVLIIAWKWEKTGGIILTIIGLAFSIFIFVFNYKRNHFPIMTCLLQAFIIAIPFVLAGILFILSHFRKKKELYGAQ